MIFLDRISGKTVSELPKYIIPGQYCTQTKKVRYNHHTDLDIGDLILDDGTGYIKIGEQESYCNQVKMDEKIEADAELTILAIHSIVEQIGIEDYKVSPMLPMKLAEKVDLEEVECLLAKILEAGHLHSISDRPRLDLRYDDMVSPVERVRKLAAGALNHLASHSDCWQNRTLSGVLPRKILARFSEDDYAIYENRLYKRVLDLLEKHLIRRLSLLKSLNERLESALDFQKSELTHFELRHDICALWGEAFQTDVTDKQLNNGKETQRTIEKQLHQIRSLKQRGLYRLIPTAGFVPTQVHRTNVLSHDSHYRHLPILWDSLSNKNDENRVSPDERFKRQKLISKNYSIYVGLVIRRSLEKFILFDNNKTKFMWSGRKFIIRNKGYDWVISEDRNKDDLRFIPIAWFGTDQINSIEIDQYTLVCTPRACSSMSDRHLQVTPLDLYVVERIGAKIDQWLWMRLIKNIGIPLGPLPGPVRALVKKWHEKFIEIPNSNTVRLINPLEVDQINEITALVQMFAGQTFADKMIEAIDTLRFLSKCNCGSSRTLLSTNKAHPQDFSFICESCSTVWSVKTHGFRQLFTLHPRLNDAEKISDHFLWCGRRWLEFEMAISTN